MPEVLSQSQIDALLNELIGQDEAAAAAITEERKIRPYNFRNPKSCRGISRRCCAAWARFSRGISPRISQA